MGRKKKNKINNGNTNDSTEKTVSREKMEPVVPQERTYYKIKATFKCSKDTCGKVWTSVHAWEQDETVFCEFCESKAKVDTFMDEICKLDNFQCPRCPDEHWQSIHNDEDKMREEECWECGIKVKPEGTQERFGRHFWFVCTSNICQASWEDFSLSRQHTQQCSKWKRGMQCGSRGDMIRTTKVQALQCGDKGKTSEEGPRGRGFGHDYRNCDMCRDLKERRIARSCLKYRKIKFAVDPVKDEPSREKILEQTNEIHLNF